MSQPANTASSERPEITLKTPLQHIHHVAYRCRDAEQTRWFWEDVMGFPLRMAMVFDDEPGSGRKIDYMHLFFEMGDNNFVAFFDSPTTTSMKAHSSPATALIFTSPSSVTP